MLLAPERKGRNSCLCYQDFHQRKNRASIESLLRYYNLAYGKPLIGRTPIRVATVVTGILAPLAVVIVDESRPGARACCRKIDVTVNISSEFRSRTPLPVSITRKRFYCDGHKHAGLRRAAWVGNRGWIEPDARHIEVLLAGRTAVSNAEGNVTPTTRTSGSIEDSIWINSAYIGTISGPNVVPVVVSRKIGEVTKHLATLRISIIIINIHYGSRLITPIRARVEPLLVFTDSNSSRTGNNLRRDVRSRVRNPGQLIESRTGRFRDEVCRLTGAT